MRNDLALSSLTMFMNEVIYADKIIKTFLANLRFNRVGNF